MAAGRQPQMVETGSRAPKVQIQSQPLADLLARGPVLLAFFKVSCPVCQYTLPFLERLYQGAGCDGAPVQIIGVSQDKASATRDFVEEFGVTFPVLLDEAGAGYPASNAFGLHSVPSLFLIESDGRVALAENGFSKADLETIGHRLGVAPFRPGEKIPEFRPG
jgi:peroxiredoxin